MESSLGFIVASNGCVDFRLEVRRTTFFSWRIERLRVSLRFLGFRTVWVKGFLICVTSPKFL